MACRRCGGANDGPYVDMGYGYITPDYVDRIPNFRLCDDCGKDVWRFIHDREDG